MVEKIHKSVKGKASTVKETADNINSKRTEGVCGCLFLDIYSAKDYEDSGLFLTVKLPVKSKLLDSNFSRSHSFSVVN